MYDNTTLFCLSNHTVTYEYNTDFGEFIRYTTAIHRPNVKTPTTRIERERAFVWLLRHSYIYVVPTNITYALHTPIYEMPFLPHTEQCAWNWICNEKPNEWWRNEPKTKKNKNKNIQSAGKICSVDCRCFDVTCIRRQYLMVNWWWKLWKASWRHALTLSLHTAHTNRIQSTINQYKRPREKNRHHIIVLCTDR